MRRLLDWLRRRRDAAPVAPGFTTPTGGMPEVCGADCSHAYCIGLRKALGDQFVMCLPGTCPTARRPAVVIMGKHPEADVMKALLHGDQQERAGVTVMAAVAWRGHLVRDRKRE